MFIDTIGIIYAFKNATLKNSHVVAMGTIFGPLYLNERKTIHA